MPIDIGGSQNRKSKSKRWLSRKEENRIIAACSGAIITSLTSESDIAPPVSATKLQVSIEMANESPSNDSDTLRCYQDTLADTGIP